MAEAQALRWDGATAWRLLRLSAFAIVNESSFQLALFIELALLARAVPQSSLAGSPSPPDRCPFALASSLLSLGPLTPSQPALASSSYLASPFFLAYPYLADP